MAYNSSTPSTITTKKGLVASVSDGGSITIKGNINLESQSNGAIECKPGLNKIGGKVNIIDVKELRCKSGTLIKAIDSSVVVSSVNLLKSESGSILELLGDSSSAKAIITDVSTLSSTATPIRTAGKSKCLINNISTIITDDPLFVSSSSYSSTSVIGGGSVTIKNIKSIPFGIKVYDHDLFIDNVKSIGAAVGIEFSSSTLPKDKTNVYTLTILNTERINSDNYSIRVINSCAKLDGTYLLKKAYFYNSDIEGSNCIFGSLLEINESFFKGKRTKTVDVLSTNSALSFFNSSINGSFTTTGCSVQTYNTTLLTNSYNNSSVNFYTSKVSGTVSLSNYSSLQSNNTKLLGNITNTNSFLGLYGQDGSGSVTTTGSGMTFLGGAPSKLVDGKSLSNGISTPTSTLYLLANSLDIESVSGTTLTVGGNYTLNATGSISQTGTTVTWNQSGNIEFKVGGNTMVTVTGTTVTV